MIYKKTILCLGILIGLNFANVFAPTPPKTVDSAPNYNDNNHLVQKIHAFFVILNHNFQITKKIPEEEWTIAKPLYDSVRGADPTLITEIFNAIKSAIATVWDKVRKEIKNRKLVENDLIRCFVNAHILAELKLYGDHCARRLETIYQQYGSSNPESNSQTLPTTTKNYANLSSAIAESKVIYEFANTYYVNKFTKPIALLIIEQLEHDWLLLPELDFVIVEMTVVEEIELDIDFFKTIVQQLDDNKEIENESDDSKLPKESDKLKKAVIIYERVVMPNFKHKHLNLRNSFITILKENQTAQKKYYELMEMPKKPPAQPKKNEGKANRINKYIERRNRIRQAARRRNKEIKQQILQRNAKSKKSTNHIIQLMKSTVEAEISKVNDRIETTNEMLNNLQAGLDKVGKHNQNILQETTEKLAEATEEIQFATEELYKSLSKPPEYNNYPLLEQAITEVYKLVADLKLAEDILHDSKKQYQKETSAINYMALFGSQKDYDLINRILTYAFNGVRRAIDYMRQDDDSSVDIELAYPSE